MVNSCHEVQKVNCQWDSRATLDRISNGMNKWGVGVGVEEEETP